MKYIAALLLLILNLIAIPLNIIFMKVQKWYLPMWKKDKVMYFAFAPFYWILFVLTSVFSYPCDILARLAH
ncbi:MAG: hypothetical protein NTU81_03315 [Candidatus Nomurabacteria bacterium]|nr:hypothetical protein [Candidatus Nomurabacteria bacterium]